MDTISHIWDIKRLAAGYGRQPVLRDVSMAVEEGMVLVIIGQNGSGKSTFLRTLSGLLEMHSGEIWLKGKRQRRIVPHELVREGISFFTQGSLTIPAMTVREHLLLATLCVQRKASEAIFETVFVEFPLLRKLIDQRAGNLSGGERQMLSFAILHLQRTGCWLLDEPTAGLSPEFVCQTTAYLSRKSREGVTMLMVEHNLDVALALATHVAVAKGGTLTRLFTRDEFLAPDFLKQHLYG